MEDVKFLGETLPHPIEHLAIDKTAIGDQRDDALGPDFIGCPAEPLHVWIVKFTFQLRRGGGRVGGPHAIIHCFVGPVLVVIVLVCLPRIIRRIADNDEHRCLLLLLNAQRIFRGEEGEVFQSGSARP